MLVRSFVNRVTEQLTGTLSLGAAVFASVLFASGMPSELDVVSCHASTQGSSHSVQDSLDMLATRFADTALLHAHASCLQALCRQ